MYKKKPQPESCKYPDPCEVANDCKEALSKLGIDNFQKFKHCMSVCDVLKIGALENPGSGLSRIPHPVLQCDRDLSDHEMEVCLAAGLCWGQQSQGNGEPEDSVSRMSVIAPWFVARPEFRPSFD